MDILFRMDVRHFLLFWFVKNPDIFVGTQDSPGWIAMPVIGGWNPVIRQYTSLNQARGLTANSVALTEPSGCLQALRLLCDVC
jgi:hypothetical protein